jgi:HEAT repeat protein
MTTRGFRQFVVAASLVAALPVAAAAWPDAAAAESRRMSRAKDFIADEQWARAIDELRAAVADPKETAKAEALFWLAHSLNQENDFAAAVESIRQLEREHRSSPWVRPARSLLIELAQKLKRDDVLWWTVGPAPARRPFGPEAPVAVAPRTTPKPAGGPPAAPRAEAPPAPVAVGPARVPPAPAHAPLPHPAMAWFGEAWSPDTDQRILALGSLIHTDAEKAIPILRGIAFEEENPGAARRAIFVLAESRKPAALSIVVDVATRGPEPVKLAAVRGLGSFGGPEVSDALLKVYSTANPRVKRQVVTTLGERAETPALLRIAQSEDDQSLRAVAIVTIGRCCAGGREKLASLYSKANRESKRPIILALFNARADAELIRIAQSEQDAQLRGEAVTRLRLLGTPKAREYLASAKP